MTSQYHLIPARVYSDEKENDLNLVSVSTNDDDDEEKIADTSRNDEESSEDDLNDVLEEDDDYCFPTARLQRAIKIKRQIILFVLGVAFGTLLEYLSIQCYRERAAISRVETSGAVDPKQPHAKLHLRFVQMGMFIDIGFMYAVLLSYFAVLTYRVCKKNSKSAVSAATCHVVASLSSGLAVGFCIGMCAFIHPLDTWFMVQFVVEEFLTVYCAYMFALEVQLARNQPGPMDNQEQLCEPLLVV